MPHLTIKSEGKVKHSSFISVSQLIALASSSYNSKSGRFEQAISVGTLKDAFHNGMLKAKENTGIMLQTAYHKLSFWDKLPIVAYEFGYEWARNQTPQSGIVYKNVQFNLYNHKPCEVAEIGYTQHCQLDYQFSASISISPSEMLELTGESDDSLIME